jgi:hypothetical protein
MMPTVVTAGLEAAAVWFPSNLVRALAGVPLGAAVALVVSDALTTALHDAGVRRGDHARYTTINASHRGRSHRFNG